MWCKWDIRNINSGVSANKNGVIVIVNFMSGMEGTCGTKVTVYSETPSPDKNTKPWPSLVIPCYPLLSLVIPCYPLFRG